MSVIVALHALEPRYPPNADAGVARYFVARYWVDATGGRPTLAEIQALVNPPAPARDPRLVTDDTEAAAAKVDPQVLPLINMDKPGWIAWAGANFPTLTASERTRLGILFWVVAVGVRQVLR